MVRLDQFTEEHLELGDLWRLQDGRREECFLIPLMATQAGQLFRLPSGAQLQGLMAYDAERDDVYALQVLIGGESFSFNKYLPEVSFEEVLALADRLGVGAGGVLPVRYSVVRGAMPIRDGRFTLWIGC